MSPKGHCQSKFRTYSVLLPSFLFQLYLISPTAKILILKVIGLTELEYGMIIVLFHSISLQNRNNNRTDYCCSQSDC